jgi:hypothetical protein
MSNRWLRFGIALLALVAAAGGGYRLFQQEQRIEDAQRLAQGIQASAETALVTIPEIKAALHAYVAEGQGEAFWAARTTTLIDRLRSALLVLDGPATAAGVPLTGALDLVDRLAAAEQRARDHVRNGQRLLAGEMIFTEARDVLDAMQLQLARARGELLDAAMAQHVAARREQTILVLSAFGVLAFATLLLAVPAGQRDTVPVPVATKASTAAPVEDFESSARIISRTPITPSSQAQATTAAPAARAASASTSSARAIPQAKPATPAATGGKSATPPPAAAAAQQAPPATPSLREAAVICTELGRASQSIEVSNLLARAAKVLDASGAIVWIASPDGRDLHPVASAGYDERLLARIGAIPRTANNVTAHAIRTGTARTSPRAEQSAAALAIPLLTPLGAVGVLSAEFKSLAEVDEHRLAVATIFAAQLSSVVGARSNTAATSPKANAAP